MAIYFQCRYCKYKYDPKGTPTPEEAWHKCPEKGRAYRKLKRVEVEEEEATSADA